MYTRRNIRLTVVLRFAWKGVLAFAAWSTAVTSAFIWCMERGIDISIPDAPMRDRLLEAIGAHANSATQILRAQSHHLQHVYEQDRLIDDFRHIALMDMIEEMHALQGKCERIKNTPFPRQYAYFSNVFVWIFVFLLPLGIVGQFASHDELTVWLTVPLSVLISWIFFIMETVGDASEDPFENFANDVPMTALCRTIEIDLRQMLKESDIPEPIKATNDVLM